MLGCPGPRGALEFGRGGLQQEPGLLLSLPSLCTFASLSADRLGFSDWAAHPQTWNVSPEMAEANQPEARLNGGWGRKGNFSSVGNCSLLCPAGSSVLPAPG